MFLHHTTLPVPLSLSKPPVWSLTPRIRSQSVVFAPHNLARTLSLSKPQFSSLTPCIKSLNAVFAPHNIARCDRTGYIARYMCNSKSAAGTRQHIFALPTHNLSGVVTRHHTDPQ